ncbi:MAG: T9SS type A sorting domain-containing protein [Owenweeksia sp.]|nr:T9SS type A sorting domain-containing protein [Owenweeksia sp.]
MLYRSDNPSNNVSESTATTAMPAESPRGACASVSRDRGGSTQSTHGQRGDQIESSATLALDAPHANPVEKLAVEVYPNPTSGVLNLEIRPADTQVEVSLCDATGKALLQIEQQSGVQVIDLGHFAEGLYWLKIKASQEVFTHKIYKH